MNEAMIKEALEGEFPSATIDVQLDGSHCQVTVVSDVFEGLRPVARQQRVYSQRRPARGQYHREDTLAGRLRWTTFKSAAERRCRVVYLFRGRRMQRFRYWRLRC